MGHFLVHFLGYSLLFLRGYTLTLRKEDAHNITVREDAV